MDTGQSFDAGWPSAPTRPPQLRRCCALSASTSGVTGVAQAHVSSQNLELWRGRRERRSSLRLLLPGSLCAFGDCWCQPSRTGRTHGWHAAAAVRPLDWPQRSPRLRPSALRLQGLRDHRVARAGSCHRKKLAPVDTGLAERRHQRRRGSLVDAPAGSRQCRWNPDHAGAPAASQCRRHSDPVGALTLPPQLCRQPPSEPGPSYDPRANPVRWERSRFQHLAEAERAAAAAKLAAEETAAP